MKGQILNFDIQKNEGVISTSDGSRYVFSGSEWKDNSQPNRGVWVDFDVREGAAMGVYLALGNPSGKSTSIFSPSNSSSRPESEIYTSYDQVPWFRKRVFVVLCCLFFLPAAIAIALTGEIYMLQQGEIRTFTQNQKLILVIAGSFVLFVNIVMMING
ncbi:MAG: hypothetical protein FWD50_05380 [Betaproteobacteria bacterium]|nr:hypothetical protein [Betaproteobacteria bacterium]